MAKIIRGVQSTPNDKVQGSQFTPHTYYYITATWYILNTLLHYMYLYCMNYSIHLNLEGTQVVPWFHFARAPTSSSLPLLLVVGNLETLCGTLPFTCGHARNRSNEPAAICNSQLRLKVRRSFPLAMLVTILLN